MSSSNQHFVPELPKSWLSRREKLENSIRTHLKRTPAVPFFLTESHGIVVPVLRNLVYDQSLKGQVLPIRLDDHSVTSKPIPLGLLRPLDLVPRVPPDALIRLGAMSQRHLELDYIVDGYLVRNVDISGRGDKGYQCDATFEAALAYFGSSELSEGAAILFFHTGLVPMIVGAYHALTVAIRARESASIGRNLVVVPRLYTGGDTENSFFSEDSPGSKEENYLGEKFWF